MSNAGYAHLDSTNNAVPIVEGGSGSTNASDARTNLGLGTIAIQNSNNISITGGSITGITDLAISDGGTGDSTAENARINLGSIGILSSVTDINGLSTGTTTLYTPSGRIGRVIDVILRLTAATALTGNCSISIGTNNPNYNNIFSSRILTGFNNVGEEYSFSASGVRVYVPSETSIVLIINNAFGGTTATLSADLIGFLT